VEIVSSKRVPIPPISSFVKCFWYWQGGSDVPRERTANADWRAERHFQSRQWSNQDLRFRIYDAEDFGRYGEYRRSVIFGARTTCFVIETSQEERVFGIQFHPGGAFPFFRVASAEMENRSVDLEPLSASEAIFAQNPPQH
jgi:hypothetical protein